MTSGRRLKGLLNQMWFKSKRGGTKLSPSKDLPWNLQMKEEQGRKILATGRKIDGGTDSPRSKTVETVVFVPSTPGSSLKKQLQQADDRLRESGTRSRS